MISDPTEWIHVKNVNRWKKEGAEIKRYTYSLNQNSIVFDMGGYEGSWSAEIYNRYHCKIKIFEPVKAFSEAIEKRFFKNTDIEVYPFGLSDKTETVVISLDKNGSSLFTKSSDTEKVRMIKASDFFQKNNITHIDLMKINIEGGEYPLLEDLLQNGLTKNIKNLQIQFHHFAPNGIARMKKIQEALTKTHVLTYHYPLVWENWTLKK